jgi:DNA-binding transcriptional regulator YiaG
MTAAAREMSVSTDAVQDWEQGRRTPGGLYAAAVERYIRGSCPRPIT